MFHDSRETVGRFSVLAVGAAYTSQRRRLAHRTDPLEAGVVVLVSILV